MERVEERLNAIRSLVDHAKIGFVEGELTPLVFELIEDLSLIAPEKHEQTQRLLDDLCTMEKSTGLGNGMYSRLSNSRSPLTEGVLCRAIDSEPYYNCNDAAFKSYVIVALRASDVSPLLSAPLIENIKDGHDSNYIDRLRTMKQIRPLEAIALPGEFRSTVINTSLNSRFSQTRSKALCVATYFSIDEISDALSDRINQARLTEEIGYHFLLDLSSDMTAYECLTGDTRFHQFVEDIHQKVYVFEQPYQTDFKVKTAEKLRSL